MSQNHRKGTASRALPLMVGGLALGYALLSLASDTNGGALAADGSGKREVVLHVNGDNGQVNVSVVQGQFTMVDPSGKQTQVGDRSKVFLPAQSARAFASSQAPGANFRPTLHFNVK